jgi:hypothetical protein
VNQIDPSGHIYYATETPLDEFSILFDKFIETKANPGSSKNETKRR